MLFHVAPFDLWMVFDHGVFTHGPGHLWTRGRNLKDMASIKGSKIRIGGGFSQEAAKDLVRVFLSTEFEGGRHIARIKKIE